MNSTVGPPVRVLAAAAVLLLLSGASSPQSKERTVAQIVKESSDAVVQVVVSDSSGQDLGLGSGFIVSQDGRIVTNYHVINGAHSAIVKLTNGAFFPVDGVLAADKDRDLALLKVSGKNLPFLTLAYTPPQIGEHVVAIGSPLGLDNTVSDGIVSAVREERPGKSWIQTTAPVSHGNSGGPLLNSAGKVIGVITLGVNPQVGQNLNFAVPSDAVKALLASAANPTPFESLGAAGSAALSGGSSNISGPVWTSLITGNDYKVRIDGDYLYSEWVNVPTQLQGTPAFSRSEFKKGGDGIWRGKARAYLPCQYRDTWTGQSITKWCRREADIEIDLISDSRIEGKAQVWETYDCKRCEPKGPKEQPFAWIPKD